MVDKWEYAWWINSDAVQVFYSSEGNENSIEEGSESYPLYKKLGGEKNKDEFNELQVLHMLNHLGSQGWELSAVDKDVYFFKRKVTS